MFNVRIKKFLDTEQIQIFSKILLSSGSEREDKRKVIRETGEIVPLNRRIIYNPFEKEEVVGYEVHDDNNGVYRSCRRSKNKIYDIAKSNEWEWFFTLTFNKEKVNRYDYASVTKKLSLWLNNMRKICPDMKYLVVPEQHEDGAWHFHGLFANVENMEFVSSGKRDKHGRTIYNVGKYRLGFTEATKIGDLVKASNYIAKYITVDLCFLTEGKKRYWYSRNCDLPQVIDLLVENKSELINEWKKSAIYEKECKGYIDVTYMEKSIYTTNTDDLSQVK